MPGPSATATEGFLLATIVELLGIIRDLRKEIAAFCNAEVSQQPKVRGARQKERHARKDEKGDATQRTQLAQPPPKQTYAAAVQASTRRGRLYCGQEGIASRWYSSQPVADELQRTAEKGGYGAVLPAPPYRDRDLADMGAAPAIDALLRSVGWSGEELALTSAHLLVTATSR